MFSFLFFVFACAGEPQISLLLVCVILTDASILTLIVPETSYSSSEGEDDFFDANDDPFSSQGNSPR